MNIFKLFNQRRRLKKQLIKESEITREDSLDTLRDFEDLDDDLCF